MITLPKPGAVGKRQHERGGNPRSSETDHSVASFPPPVKRSWIRSWLAGIWHVMNGAYLGDYLAYVFHFRARRMPQGRQVVPLEVSDGGRVLRVAKKLEAHPWEPYLEPGQDNDPIRPLRVLNHPEACIVEQGLKLAHAELHQTDEAYVCAGIHRDAAANRLREVVEDGTAAVPATVSRAAHKRGRPRWHAWKLIALCLAMAILLTAEAYQLFLPYINSVGIDSTNLNAEWQRNAIGITMGAAFAGGVSAFLCLLLAVVVRLALHIYDGAGSVAQRAAMAVLAVCLGALVIWTTHGIAGMRQGLGSAAENFAAVAHGSETELRNENGEVFFVFALLLPIGVAYLGHLAKEEHARGKKIRTEQREWDIAENRLQEVRERAEEVLRIAQEDVTRIENHRERVQELIDALHDRVIRAQDEIRRVVESERAYAWAFAHAMVACHWRDCFYFARAALRRKRPDLLARTALRVELPQMVTEYRDIPAPNGEDGHPHSADHRLADEHVHRQHLHVRDDSALGPDGRAPSPGTVDKMISTFSVVIAVTLGMLAGTSAVSADTAPGPARVDVELICGLAPTAGTLDCSPDDLRGAFDAWVKQAILLPDSAFVVWSIGHDRSAVVPAYVACIPESWGSGVLEAKAEYLRRGRELAGVADPTNPIRFPSNCGLPQADAEGAREIRVLSPTLVRIADAFSAVPPSNDQPLHVAVVCDRSNSGLGRTCTQRNIVAAFDRWLQESKVVPGSTFTSYGVGRSFDTAKMEFRVSIDSGAPIATVGALLGARNEIHVRGSDADDNASAVAEAIAVAGTELHERSGRRELIILSDLREFLAGIWNFERSVPSPAVFFDWLKRTGLLTDLHDTKVLACGAHNGRSPDAGPFAPQLAAAVRETWQVALRAMGAVDLRIVSQCDEVLAVGDGASHG